MTSVHGSFGPLFLSPEAAKSQTPYLPLSLLDRSTAPGVRAAALRRWRAAPRGRPGPRSPARLRALLRRRAAPAVRTAPAIITTKLILNHLVDQPLCVHASAIASLRAGIHREYQEPLIAMLVERHEHVRSCLQLHSPELAAAVAGDPAFAVLGDMHLRAVVALGSVIHRDLPAPLLQQPLDELLAAPPLLQCASHERHVADVL
mmetsp:Transcript_66352/g.188405  ORF Transcript_66352/g.188405 Transcript_66352/m.188405 type:complete len:204 (+) Transcript_66352:106-717(+)